MSNLFLHRNSSEPNVRGVRGGAFEVASTMGPNHVGWSRAENHAAEILATATWVAGIICTCADARREDALSDLRELMTAYESLVRACRETGHALEPDAALVDLCESLLPGPSSLVTT
jgi:hypothetical protein